jgi:peptidoglycan hydrolase-like protein with peptidoglycan-binding domain
MDGVRPVKINRIWAPAMSVLALAFPATAIGAQTRGLRSGPAAGTSGPLAHAVGLGPGSGYKSARGSLPVRVIQSRLARTGYAPGPIDGRFGPMTRRAVVAFQTVRGLPADGVVGPLTLAALMRVPASPPNHGRGGGGPDPTRPGLARLGVAPPDVARSTSVPPRVASPSHRGSAPSRGELLTLCALALTLIVGAWLYIRRRRGNRIAPTSDPAVDAIQTATPVRDSDLARLLDSHVATVRVTAVPVATSRAPIATNGAGVSFPTPDSLAPSNDRGAPADDEAAYRRADQVGDAVGAFNLGVLLEERGAMGEAETAYRRAAKKGHGAAASNLGVLLEERGASAEAEAAYRCADRCGEASGAFNLGVLLEERGAIGEADAALNRAAEWGRGEIVDIARAALLDVRKGRQASAVSLAASGGHHA